MATYVIGDIHGYYTALTKCLKSVSFDKSKDTLIVLGDVVDRGPNSPEVVETLLSIPNLIAIRGNHDEWFMQYIVNGVAPEYWLSQGGAETLAAYSKHKEELKFVHYYKYFAKTKLYYVDGNNNLFVHAGIDLNTPIEEQPPLNLLSDRTLYFIVQGARGVSRPHRLSKKFNNIFIGHTPVQHFTPLAADMNATEPIICCGVVALDTGVIYNENLLTIMDVSTLRYKQAGMQ